MAMHSNADCRLILTFFALYIRNFIENIKVTSLYEHYIAIYVYKPNFYVFRLHGDYPQDME